MNQQLSIGSIFTVKNDPRKLIVVGYGNNDTYIVCVCDDKKVDIQRPYLIGKNLIEKVLCLGYVLESNIGEKIITSDNTNQSSAVQQPKQSGGYQFDENGVVIGYN